MITCYSIFNIEELLLGYIILQGTYTQDGLIERPLLLSDVTHGVAKPALPVKAGLDTPK